MSRKYDEKLTEIIEIRKQISRLRNEALRTALINNIQIDYGTFRNSVAQSNTGKTIYVYKFCNNCGDELPENAYYCIMCGRQLRS